MCAIFVCQLCVSGETQKPSGDANTAVTERPTQDMTDRADRQITMGAFIAAARHRSIPRGIDVAPSPPRLGCNDGRRHDAPSASVILEVSDQGCGIPAEDLARVTDPFFTTKRDSGGTGLGLSISARIVEEHGGMLTFESRPGQGTRVRVVLPVASSMAETESDGEAEPRELLFP